MHKKSTVFIFIATLLAFLSLANLIVYDALVFMFDLTAPNKLILLGAVLGISSASFIASSFLGSWFYNWFTRFYYKIFVVWMGFFVYLFFSCTVYAILGSLFQVRLRGLGVGFILFSMIATVYGIFHARHIQVVNIKVKLPNLPLVWDGRKAVWISDIHLGQIHGPKFAKKVTEKVNALSPDFVFIGGDLFDGTSAPDIVELIYPFSKLTPKIKTYFITGNHEEFGNSEKFISAVRDISITTLIDEMVNIEGLQLIGVDYKNASKKEKFEEILQSLNIDRQKPSILLKHEPKDLDVAEKCGVSFQISGHTHRGQQWPLNFMAKLVYKGYEYGLKSLLSMQVYTSSGVGTWGPPIRVGTNAEIVLIEFTEYKKTDKYVFSTTS